MSSVATWIIVPLLSLSADPDLFREVRIEKPFDGYLQANRLLMESTGAKVVRLPKQRFLVVAVASTVLKDSSATERLRAEKVCRIKALAYVLQERKGVQVFHTEESRERTIIVNTDGKETGKNVSEFLEITRPRSRVSPRICRWSGDGSRRRAMCSTLRSAVSSDRDGTLVEEAAHPSR